MSRLHVYRDKWSISGCLRPGWEWGLPIKDIRDLTEVIVMCSDWVVVIVAQLDKFTKSH